MTDPATQPTPNHDPHRPTPTPPEREGRVVELWQVPGCPHGAAYLPRLQHLVDAAAVPATVRTRVVTSVVQAVRERFLGSPTVRVDGIDVEPGAGRRSAFAVSCRLYRTPAGLHATPPEDWIVAALTAPHPSTPGARP
jgi:hypothetical protein